MHMNEVLRICVSAERLLSGAAVTATRDMLVGTVAWLLLGYPPFFVSKNQKAFGSWLVAFGSWLVAFGFWLLAFGFY